MECFMCPPQVIIYVTNSIKVQDKNPSNYNVLENYFLLNLLVCLQES